MDMKTHLRFVVYYGGKRPLRPAPLIRFGSVIRFGSASNLKDRLRRSVLSSSTSERQSANHVRCCRARLVGSACN
mgnify:CR=1 FL=1